MSTRDSKLASAGLEGVTLEAADWTDGVAGVPGDGRAGLAAGKNLKDRKEEIAQILNCSEHRVSHFFLYFHSK